MTLQLDPAELGLARRRIGALHDDLLSQQAELSHQVEQFLDSNWSGGAAAQFRTSWTQWCQGMHDVLAGIGLEGDAIALTRTTLADLDAERVAVSRRLHARLGQA